MFAIMYTSKEISVVLISIFSFIQGVHGRCDQGWQLWTAGSRCFFISSLNDIRPFFNSTTECKRQSANLLSLNNQMENQFIQKYIEVCAGPGTCPRDPSHEFWLGLTTPSPRSGTADDRRQGWRWLDGTPYQWMNWYSEGLEVKWEPNDGQKQALLLHNRFWADSVSSYKCRYICEKAAEGQFSTEQLRTTSTRDNTTWKAVYEVASTDPTTRLVEDGSTLSHIETAAVTSAGGRHQMSVTDDRQREWIPGDHDQIKSGYLWIGVGIGFTAAVLLVVPIVILVKRRGNSV